MPCVQVACARRRRVPGGSAGTAYVGAILLRLGSRDSCGKDPTLRWQYSQVQRSYCRTLQCVSQIRTPSVHYKRAPCFRRLSESLHGSILVRLSALGRNNFQIATPVPKLNGARLQLAMRVPTYDFDGSHPHFQTGTRVPGIWLFELLLCSVPSS